jgi:branched-chain amino acid transport system permease protein
MTSPPSSTAILRRWLLVAALFAGTLTLVLTLRPAEIVVLNNIMVLALFAVSTNLLLGTAGLISFGQACFYGLGSYIIAMAWFHNWTYFWVAALLAPFFGGLAAFLVGALALRSQRWFFALLTLAFSQLFFTIAQKAFVYTQGDTGIFGAMVPDMLADPRSGGVFILIVSAIAMLALYKITDSPLGLTLRAIRENQRRVSGLGVNTYWTQLLAFTISGAFCALAGVLNAVNQQAAHPNLLDWVQSGDPILVSVIGGMHAFLGPVLGAVVYQLGHDVLVRVTTRWQLFLGAILLIVVLTFPDGMAGLFRKATWVEAARRLRTLSFTGWRQQ